VPYLKSKLDDLYEIHSGGAIRYFSTTPLPSHPPETATQKQKVLFYMKRYFRIVYPYVNAGWYLAILGWHLRYLFGKTDAHNPLFKLFGMRMQRLGPHDSVLSSLDLLTLVPTPSTNQFSRQCLTLSFANNSPPNKSSASACILTKSDSSNLDISSQILGMVVIVIISSPSQSINKSIPRPPRSFPSHPHSAHRLNLSNMSHRNSQPNCSLGKRLRLLLPLHFLLHRT
jgi:hypothetical protein